MLYVQALPGTFLSMDPSSFVDVYGYIGTPRIWKQKSSLIWRLGPSYLFEEDISMDALALIIKLGPRYCGNFQAVHLQGTECFDLERFCSYEFLSGYPVIYSIFIKNKLSRGQSLGEAFVIGALYIYNPRETVTEEEMTIAFRFQLLSA